MVNNIFKILFLLLGISLVIVLYGIYMKLDNGRFTGMVHGETLDTRTGNKYYWEEGVGYTLYNDKGRLIEVKKIPK